MAEGALALAQDRPDDARFHFDFVLAMREEVTDQVTVSLAHYWIARCQRRKGEYDDALKHAGIAGKIALDLGFPLMAAVMQVLEGWLLFQQGKWKDAVRISQAAEHVLADTDDYVTLGNVQSFYGRMARREGRFDEAIKFFENAICHYRKRDPQHPNLARSLANMALAKRGIALQLQKTIDRDAERRRKGFASKQAKPGATSDHESSDQDSHKHAYRGQVAQLRREALER